jgi:hypothetical protein
MELDLRYPPGIDTVIERGVAMSHRSVPPRLIVAVALLLAAVAPALAGEVYGRVTMGGAPVGSLATVAAQCGDKAYPPQATDKAGTYHLIVGQSGKCSLIVSYKGASASLEFVSHEDAVQYDIDLEMKDGKLAARRR